MMKQPSCSSDAKRPRAYLASAMEYAPDGGVEWRREIIPVLERLGHTYYDATQVEYNLLTAEEKANFKNWKRNDHARFRQLMRKIIDHDLGELLEGADYVIARWDEWTKLGGGTHGEITCAYRAGIPVYFIAAIQRDQISGWILGCADEVFDDLPALASFLKKKYQSE